MGENICQLYIRQGINNQTLQGDQKEKLKSQRSNNPMRKWANELNSFQRMKYKWPNNKKKKCSTYLSINKAQIKMTLRFHLMPVRMAITENTKNNKCWKGFRKKKNRILSIVGGNIN
jgi:hypothetical protein